MKYYPQSVCQLVFLSLCCVLITVRESRSAFVPGRCLCPVSIPGVRGQLKELKVYPTSPSCDKFTVIVTLKSTNEQICLKPDGPMGKQLIRCWRRSQNMGRDTKMCLKRLRRRRGGQRQKPQQRSRSHKKKASSPNSH
ncbi:C-X-C motif chemokine 9-like [Mastacembelus armatus]|uniref:C-X-C motif chemokine 9-like n=1 Tax=Mastacembelus armatus TaxID=205130 RepID=A0A7N9AU57_9TELE|nr:C-X-C motif chemokine 9-like [Mastacembelus armatus]